LESFNQANVSVGCTEYWGPCDESAQDQLDLRFVRSYSEIEPIFLQQYYSHHVWTLALDGELLTAPVLNPQVSRLTKGESEHLYKYSASSIWVLVLGFGLCTFKLLFPISFHIAELFYLRDIADKYPSSHVVGIDVSEMQPKFVPPNVEFLIDDFNASSYEERQKYDLIHGRQLLGSVANWPRLIEKCYR